ncbi:kinase-like domain-containing protein [Peziza echinospora]|nr:kinase-like domain-containing protein [Peziza echinospora]
MSKGDTSPYPQWLSITGAPLNLTLPHGLLGNCRSIKDYTLHEHLGEGTYGVVYRATDNATHKVYAVKQMRLSERERSNGMPITSIREIALLRSLRHSNVVGVVDVAVGGMGDVWMVMEYAEQDMAHLLDELRVDFSLSEVKCLMKQLMEGVEYIHKQDIIHRDIKMSNLLYTHNGVLKLADFGMARPYQPRPLTPDVVTIWYRPPEILLGTSRYTKTSDIWSCGLILGELLLLTPLLPGNSELEQLSLITALLGGPPTDDVWPKMRLLPSGSGGAGGGGRRDRTLQERFRAESKETLALLSSMIVWDPEKRLSARRVLEHRWFTREEPRPKEVRNMPSFPEVRKRAAIVPYVPPPPAAPAPPTSRGGGGGYGGGGGSERKSGSGRDGGTSHPAAAGMAEGGGVAAALAAAAVARRSGGGGYAASGGGVMIPSGSGRSNSYSGGGGGGGSFGSGAASGFVFDFDFQTLAAAGGGGRGSAAGGGSGSGAGVAGTSADTASSTASKSKYKKPKY